MFESRKRHQFHIRWIVISRRASRFGDWDAQQMASVRKSIQVRIGGRVQGVGFRAWTQRRASLLGLDGSVANQSDGSVRATISGPADAVDRMLTALRAGPAGADVDRISCEDTADEPPLGDGFRIVR